MFKIIFLFLFVFANPANAFLVQGYDVSKAWEGAQVHVPSNFLVKSIDNVKVDSPLPVVVFLHGCTTLEPLTCGGKDQAH